MKGQRFLNMRIDKLLSELGIASRKDAAKVARSGGITVDGVVVRDTSKHIDPDNCSITYLGREVVYQKYTYVMLNKPTGYVSATDDKSLPYVTELLPDELRRRELFPVGRLDRDTVGLMILTNNGVLAHSLLSPKHHVTKEYYFTAAEPLRLGAEEQFKNGVTLADGYECKSAELYLSEDRREGRIVLTEGKYHQIKRMIASRDNRVTSLERISFGGIALDPALDRGEWRYLTDEEITLLEEQG
jgi:16S rRNA pseudouridine516 synthase